MRRLSPTFVRQSDNRHLLHRRMTQEHSFDFDRRNIFSAADDYVFQTIANFNVTIRVDYGSVASMKPAVAHSPLSCVHVVIVAGHHDVAAHHDLARRLTVVRSFLPVLVNDSCLTGSDQLNALSCFDNGEFSGRQTLMLAAWLTNGDERSGFRQTVDMRHGPVELVLQPLDG